MDTTMKKTVMETSCMEDTAKLAAEGLGIEEPVSSPTFTILQIYEEGRLPLYHFDVYRIEEPEEMEEVGFDDYIYGDGVCLIEWAGRIEEILPGGQACIINTSQGRNINENSGNRSFRPCGRMCSVGGRNPYSGVQCSV